ncbi:MAG: ankyrin repeat domain-containing protein [Steroidobacteraceae bacterium]
MARIAQRFGVEPYPDPDALSGAFWNACHGGQLAMAEYLLVEGADPNWAAPWSEQTPLEIATRSGHAHIATWLIGKGAVGRE